MKQIEELNIGHNFQIGDQVLDAIGRSEKTVELQKLIVVQTAVTEDGIEQIG